MDVNYGGDSLPTLTADDLRAAWEAIRPKTPLVVQIKCAPADVATFERVLPPQDRIFGGIRVVENELMPRGYFALVDTDGNVQIARLTDAAPNVSLTAGGGAG